MTPEEGAWIFEGDGARGFSSSSVAPVGPFSPILRGKGRSHLLAADEHAAEVDGLRHGDTAACGIRPLRLLQHPLPSSSCGCRHHDQPRKRRKRKRRKKRKKSCLDHRPPSPPNHLSSLPSTPSSPPSQCPHSSIAGGDFSPATWSAASSSEDRDVGRRRKGIRGSRLAVLRKEGAGAGEGAQNEEVEKWMDQELAQEETIREVTTGALYGGCGSDDDSDNSL
eukprot:765426-Hanusia_phi.AAC.2